MTEENDKQNQMHLASANKGQVVQLRDFDHGQIHRFLLDIREYWNKQRGANAVPCRTDIQASGLGSAVDYAFIAERIAPGTARYRLAGQHLHKVMGMEVRGLPLASILHPASRKEFAAVLETVFQTPQIAQFWLTAYSEYARPQMTGRLLLLPLKSDLGDIARILGCLITEGTLGQTPRRFELERYEISSVISGGRTIQSKATIPQVTSAPRSVFAPSSKISSIATPEQRRLNFTVISSNEKTDRPFSP